MSDTLATPTSPPPILHSSQVFSYYSVSLNTPWNRIFEERDLCCKIQQHIFSHYVLTCDAVNMWTSYKEAIQTSHVRVGEEWREGQSEDSGGVRRKIFTGAVKLLSYITAQLQIDTYMILKAKILLLH